MSIEQQTFGEKVRSMTAGEIIRAMVESLRHPVTRIKMATFGEQRNGICYGCAATNTICRIGNFDPIVITSGENRRYDIDPIIDHFERAIDSLRRGNIFGYNEDAGAIKIAKITPKEGLALFVLNDGYTERDLLSYLELADYQDEIAAKTKEAGTGSAD